MREFSAAHLPRLLKRSLRKQPGAFETAPARHLAAVLVPLYLHEGQWHALFTRRTENVETHRGQVSFPGGLIEPGDKDSVQAALREAEEEIGLAPQDVRVLGHLDPSPTLTHFLILPVVGTIPWPYPLRPNIVEVASVFGVPLAWLADPENVRSEMYSPPDRESSVPVHFFHPYQGEVIWGATARIVLNLLTYLPERKARNGAG
jgi:8-oxo-dGTP pyrophosphatase MutT (NUDIX family)